jgi:secreted trypsin-like serine protease
MYSKKIKKKGNGKYSVAPVHKSMVQKVATIGYDRVFLTFIILFSRAEFHAQNKIVGGDAAVEGQFPYQVSFRYQSGFHFCGGAIYNERTIITASHCCDGQDPSNLKVQKLPTQYPKYIH